MNTQTKIDDLSIADQLLKQLEDQYMAVVSQNIKMPKQNIEPEDDPQNPYQPLEFDDEDEESQEEADFDEKINEPTQQIALNEEPTQEQAAQNLMEEIQKMKISQSESNPQIKELIEVPPTSDSIYTDLPHKQFNIDEDKIKSFALSMDIDEPEWLKDQNLCKTRIEQLFAKNANKPFTKI